MYICISNVSFLRPLSMLLPPSSMLTSKLLHDYQARTLTLDLSVGALQVTNFIKSTMLCREICSRFN